jgi:hypothetical protein
MTSERLRELLHYDPATGVFTRLVKTNRNVRVGDVAGWVNRRGYRYISVDGRLYFAHRLAWLYVTGEWPADQIDHINGIPGDNRWANLRLATGSQNQANARKRADNTSGYKGICWHGPKRKWQARIWVNSRNKSLGYFDSPADAHAAYVVAAQHHFGSFARAK